MRYNRVPVPLIDCPECNNRISDRAAACPSCGYATAQLPDLVGQLTGLVQALKCPCCGAAVTKGASECQFCGSHLQTSGAPHRAACTQCRAELIEGQSLCGACGAPQFMTEQLRNIATKVQFSQNKLRRFFVPSLQARFEPDEFIYAHTYGPKQY